MIMKKIPPFLIFLIAITVNAYGWVEIKKTEIQDSDGLIYVYTQGSGGTGCVYEGLNIYKFDEDTKKLGLIFSTRLEDRVSFRDVTDVTERKITEPDDNKDGFKKLLLKTKEYQEKDDGSIISSKNLPDEVYVFNGKKYKKKKSN